MGSLNPQAERRARQPEATDIVDILGDLQREVRLLFEQLRDDIRYPAMQYEMYPRVRSALEILITAEQGILLPAARQIGTETFVDEAKLFHRKVYPLRQHLDLNPWIRTETDDDEWQQGFQQLYHLVTEHLREADIVLERIRADLPSSVRDRLGDEYKDLFRSERKKAA